MLNENFNFDQKTQVLDSESNRLASQNTCFLMSKFCKHYNIEPACVPITRVRKDPVLRPMLDGSNFRPSPNRDPTPGRNDPTRHGPELPG